MDTKNLLGRQAEQAVLRSFLEAGSPRFLALYGRRRVGKTYLIRRFFEHQSLLLEVTGKRGASHEVQIELLCSALERMFEFSIESPRPKTWKEAFELLTKYATTYIQRRANLPLVIFLDELPWLAARDPQLIEELDHFWNTQWSRLEHFKLIVCGSAASWILDNIVDATGGLHNRITDRILLSQFNLPETKEYLNSKNIHLPLMSLIELYMCLGGVPFYLERIPPQLSTQQIVHQLCFAKAAPLEGEFEIVFESLFDKSTRHRSVLDALAGARYGLSQQEIATRCNLSLGGSFTNLLYELETCGFIKRYVPFGRKERDSYYRLVDAFSLFHKAWIEPSRKKHVAVQDNYWALLSNSQAFASWAGYSFETICHLHANQILRKLGISGVAVLISHWLHQDRDTGSKAQVDMVLDRADQTITLCEAKFTKAPVRVSKSLVERLRNTETLFRDKTKTKKFINHAIISCSGVVENELSREIFATVVEGDDLCEA